jgi:hypothetical protein
MREFLSKYKSTVGYPGRLEKKDMKESWLEKIAKYAVDYC